MKRRLFISTKEVYCPDELPIVGANYHRQEKDKDVELLIEKSKDEHSIWTSSDEEAQWFCAVIFATLDLEEDIVIDYTTKKYYSINEFLKDIAFVKESHKLSNDAIQQLKPEDEDA